MLELLRKEIPTLHLVRNINMNINLITNKHLFLTNVFYASELGVKQQRAVTVLLELMMPKINYGNRHQLYEI